MRCLINSHIQQVYLYYVLGVILCPIRNNLVHLCHLHSITLGLQRASEGALNAQMSSLEGLIEMPSASQGFQFVSRKARHTRGAPSAQQHPTSTAQMNECLPQRNDQLMENQISGYFVKNCLQNISQYLGHRAMHGTLLLCFSLKRYTPPPKPAPRPPWTLPHPPLTSSPPTKPRTSPHPAPSLCISSLLVAHRLCVY